MMGKNVVPDKLMLLFTAKDRVIDSSKLAAYNTTTELDEVSDRLDTAEILTYRSSVGALRSRLSLQGFPTERVTRKAIELLQAELTDPDAYTPEDWARARDSLGGAEQQLRALVRRQREVLFLFRAGRSGSALEQYLGSTWESLCEAFDDPRFRLSLLLGPARSRTSAILDLTDLLLGGYVQAEEKHHEIAQFRLANEVAASGPIIVVTEGATDARILRRAIELADPEVAPFFRFLEFEHYSAPGGTDRVVSLTRGLAAAGVMNRVVAVVDNDTAGAHAERTLIQSGLPNRMTVAKLPDIEYGRNYPTVGPTGVAPANINGFAVSIELMFGMEVLTSANSGRVPYIRWSGYNDAMKRYQGAITSKREIQRVIWGHLESRCIEELSLEVADGCRRLAQFLMCSAAHATPAMSSEYSSLVWELPD